MELACNPRLRRYSVEGEYEGQLRQVRRVHATPDNVGARPAHRAAKAPDSTEPLYGPTGVPA
eukprot:44971-Eustigmatos_ZCMA.PRE.1